MDPWGTPDGARWIDEENYRPIEKSEKCCWRDQGQTIQE